MTRHPQAAAATSLFQYQTSKDLTVLRNKRADLAARIKCLKSRSPVRHELELRLKQLTIQELQLTTEVES